MSSAGHWLALSSNADNSSATVSADIYLVRADGTRLTDLTHEPDGHQSFTPAWAPRGHRLVFAHTEPGVPGGQLRTMRRDGRHSTVLFQGAGGRDERPDWR